MGMRRTDKREKLLPYQPKPLVEVKLGVQRVAVICPVEEQSGLAEPEVQEDPADQGVRGGHADQGSQGDQAEHGAQDGQAVHSVQKNADKKVEKESEIESI